MKIRQLSALLCAIVLLSAAAISCGKSERNVPAETGVVTIGESAEFPLESVTIVRPDSPTDNEKAAATAIRLALAERGITAKVSGEAALDAKNRNYEILVGKVSRPETEQVLSELGTQAVWAVRAVGNKIVIASPFQLLLGEAVERFVSMLGAASGKTLALPLAMQSDPHGTVALVENGKQKYRLVYSADIPAQTYNAMSELSSVLFAATGRTVASLTDASVASVDRAAVNELLIGSTCLPESVREAEALAPSDYGIALRGNKLLALGRTELSGKLAVDLLRSLLQTFTNADGTKSVYLLYDAPIVYSLDGYYLDFPRPEDLSETANLDAANDNMQFVYQNASAVDFIGYCAALEAHDFELYDSNIIGSNRYAAYTSESGILYLSYTAAVSTLRVVSAPKESALYPVSAESYTAVTTPDVALLSLTYNEASNNGMCMVFTLSDGSYLVWDGGENSSHAGILFEYLEQHNRRADGKIVIAGWFLTHAHTDHYGAFPLFASSFGKRVEVEAIYANGYSEWAVTCTVNTALSSLIPTYANAFANGKAKFVKVHTGEKLRIRDATVEILLTHEDFCPDLINDANDTSTVCMVTLGGKRVLVTGDAHNKANALLVRNFGSSLACDIFQVPHHGHSGMSVSLADAASPSIALFPTGEYGYNKYKNQTENRYLIGKVGESNVYYADGMHKIFSLGS